MSRENKITLIRETDFGPYTTDKVTEESHTSFMYTYILVNEN